MCFSRLIKTVFILGAGASKDFGYPLGVDLKADILRDIEPRQWLYNDLVTAGHSREAIVDFATKFLRSDFGTIDEFLQTRKMDSPVRKIGKQAIVLAIAKREDKKHLFDRTNNWCRSLSEFYKKNHSLISDQHFSFFTFNYDRSFEHYLHESLTSSYEELQETVRENFLHGANFTHVHGSVGRLPWQKITEGNVDREYGGSIPLLSLATAAQDIQLPDENLSRSEALARALHGANDILIIGFGFHEANCKRILLDEIGRDPKKRVFVSVVALSPEKRAMLQEMPSVRLIESDANFFITSYLGRLGTKTLEEWGESENQKQARRNQNFATLVAALPSKK